MYVYIYITMVYILYFFLYVYSLYIYIYIAMECLGALGLRNRGAALAAWDSNSRPSDR